MSQVPQIESSAPRRPRFDKRLIGWAIAAAVVALFFLNSPVFFVDQTELANVRRFGNVIYPKDQPLGPGPHFKIPFVDAVDKLQVTLQTLHIPPFDVLTIDNQKVSIEENFNYTIGKEQVYHVMYEVGRSGSIDITTQVIPVAHDRTARVFASQNMVTVNQNREVIQQQVEKAITKSVEDLFGITPHSLQIVAIKPSDAFMASIDQATLAKNAAIAAENQLHTRQFEAQQAAAVAKGQADAAIENARGQAESTRLIAEAGKIKLELEGQGLQASYEAQIKPFGSVDKYIEYLSAKAALQWNGQVPAIVSNGSDRAGNTLVIPVPEGVLGARPAHNNR
jgi:modulator of FtsH protease HflC